MGGGGGIRKIEWDWGFIEIVAEGSAVCFLLLVFGYCSGVLRVIITLLGGNVPLIYSVFIV